MKVILRADVDGVGKKGDVVEVADGHGRNLLIPKGLALKATPGAERQAEGDASVPRAQRRCRPRADAEEMATRLVGMTITIAARAGEGGKLFGSVTTSDVVTAVEEQANVVLDRRALDAEPIKELGTHHGDRQGAHRRPVPHHRRGDRRRVIVPRSGACRASAAPDCAGRRSSHAPSLCQRSQTVALAAGLGLAAQS